MGDNKHILNGNFPKLRFITDGSVLQDANILIKNKVNSSNPWYYLRKNKYDVVIVDEAHEHNPNMEIPDININEKCTILQQ